MIEGDEVVAIGGMGEADTVENVAAVDNDDDATPR